MNSAKPYDFKQLQKLLFYLASSRFPRTDGIVGPKTIAAINRMDTELFIAQYTIARIKHYLDLANSDPKRYAIYLRGWLNRAMEALT